MSDRLFVAVMGNRNSGKSTTWNTLFKGAVRTGKRARSLELYGGECCEVFLVSGSPEERGKYAGDILEDMDCKIVLCSVQYTEAVQKTFSYVTEAGFDLFVQWLNPGFSDSIVGFDRLGLVSQLLAQGATFSIRDGHSAPSERTEELRQFIFGWAKARDLTFTC
ncbi:hypothetical protein [Sphingorhabdus sp.]|uniref:hypothetical protein n=1 Tax=Sphingorhabdus sp. TaxID=1902408 RepID=UPI0035B10BD2